MNARQQLSGLDHYWLPFTPNRYFQEHPKILAGAKGAYYTTDDGRQLFDCLSGMWCCPLGHGHPKIVEALTRQAQTLDYSPAFQICNPVTLRLAARIAAMAPAGLTRVFFTNSGSEAVDTALKVAYGYHRLRGEASRIRFIGRERGYHGVGFGGMSVGGMVGNRKMFGPIMMGGVDHLPHTYNLSRMAFSKGQPTWGAHLADELERIVALHDASTIAAVIVEPMSGSAGVLVPPVGYLQKLRDICTRHGILLIFDEVITGFGRLGTPFAANYFGVTPDLMTTAKGITNGTIPCGAVFASCTIHDTLMTGPQSQVELFHGYTYSAHPVACAAGIATLDIYRDEGLLTRGATLADYWRDALHSLKGAANVIDIRNLGLMGAVEVAPRQGAVGARGYDVMVDCFNRGLYLRQSGDSFAMSPPLIVERSHIDDMVSILGDAIKRVA